MNLDTAKAGDVVIVHRGFFTGVAKIERRTKHYIFVGGDKYNANGYRVGNHGFHRSSIRLPKDGEVAKVLLAQERERLLSKLRSYNWESLKRSQLSEISRLLNLYEAEKVDSE